MRSAPLLKSSLVCLLASAALLPAALARAADYDPPVVVDQAPEYTPVEVGSGWYLRGDVGASVNDFQHSEDDGLDTEKHPLVASIAMGYHWTDYLRTELALGILPSDEFSNDFDDACTGQETTTTSLTVGGTVLGSTTRENASRPCNRPDSGYNRSYSLFANAYFDLGTYAGFTPYAGGGVGAVYTKAHSSRGDKACEASSSSTAAGDVTTTKNFACYGDGRYDGSDTSDGQYNFAYNLGAGMSYRLSTNGSIDLGYEYINVPDAETVTYDNGTFGTEKGIDVHAVKVGFRYDVW